jgi:hypothetical protein
VILLAFLTNVRDVCLFRRGPEDTPYSPGLLIGLLLACGVLQVLFDLDTGAPPALTAAALLGGLAVVGVLFLLLRGRGKPERFVQTATVVAAVYLVFGIVANALALTLPLASMRKELLKHSSHLPELTGGQDLVLLAIAALGIWQLCVWIGILRRALEVPRLGAIVLFLLLLCVNWIVAGIFAAVVGSLV